MLVDCVIELGEVLQSAVLAARYATYSFNFGGVAGNAWGRAVCKMWQRRVTNVVTTWSMRDDAGTS